MRVSDWRLADAEALAPLYAAETARWRRDLRWETASIWRQVEAARTAGTLPGFIATAPDGRGRGWSFHLRHGDTVQIGGLAAVSHEATAGLLDAVWASTEAASARNTILFGHFQAPGLIRELAGKGVAVERYRYLLRSLSPDSGALSGRPAEQRLWHAADLSEVGAVLSLAYGPDRSRPFAPGGQLPDWMEYLGQLLGTSGCGDFEPAVSVVRPAPSGGLDGVALVTRLAATTAHLAQLAVRPDAQARGVGSRLLAEVMARAFGAGYRSLTLLVSEANVRACRLYEEREFLATAAFLSGSVWHHDGIEGEHAGQSDHETGAADPRTRAPVQRSVCRGH